MSKTVKKLTRTPVSPRAVTVLRLPPADLFQRQAQLMADVILSLGKMTDQNLARQISSDQRRNDINADLAQAERFGPIKAAHGPKALRTLEVEIYYNNDSFRHRRHDTDEQRADKDRAKAEAAKHARKFTVMSRASVNEWTPAEFVRVVDAIRRNMPRVPPDGSDMFLRLPTGRCAAEEDTYKDDGRRLASLSIRTWGPLQDQSYLLWFSIYSRYKVRVHLPRMVPGSVLAALAMSRDQYAAVDLTLNNRAIAQVARASARAAELDAAQKHATQRGAR